MKRTIRINGNHVNLNKSRKKSKRKSIYIILLIILIPTLSLTGWLLYLSRDLPSLTQLEHYEPELATKIISQDGIVEESYSFTTESAPVNNPPILSGLSIDNGTTDVSLSTSSLGLTIEDPEGNTFNWTIETSPNIGSNSGNDETNGSKSNIISSLDYSTTYYWFVNATDGNSWTREWYTFTTRVIYSPDAPNGFSSIANGRFQIDLSWTDDSEADTTLVEWKSTVSPWNRGEGTELYNGTAESTSHSGLNPGMTRYYQAWSWNSTDNVWSSLSSDSATTNSNTAPTFSSVNPSNGSTGQELSLTWSLYISDVDGDSFDWTIECSNVQSSSANGASNGTKQLSITGLDFTTLYTIWVNATDSYDTTNELFTFTTRAESAPGVPISFTASANSRFQIDISWMKGANVDYTLVEWRSVPGSWNRGEGTELYNGTGTSTSQSGLNPATSRYYQGWSWNSTDNLWSSESSDGATTDSNTIPVFTSENPSNESTDVGISKSSLSISISDGDNDTFDWTIETSPDIGSSSGNNENNGLKTCSITGLEYETTYYWYVNASDDYDSINEIYWFTTTSPPVNQALSFSSILPSNGTTGVSISKGSISLTIEDPDGDIFNWTITSNPDIGSSSGYNESNGSKSCSISGLIYSTTYNWFVNATDGNLWSNASYSFTTESEPLPPPPGGGGFPPGGPLPNAAPTADAGGPYTALVTENIVFNGSESNDSDGNIVSWEWNFGDGFNASGEFVIIHTLLLESIQ